ncbi:MAG: response regulator [Verrucomicrobiota bacterium]
MSNGPRHRTNRGTILLVEDEVRVRTLANLVLCKAGYKVLLCGTTQEALTLWEQHREDIALVLTDFNLECTQNGKDLIDLLRKDRPEIIAIMMSGYIAEQDIEDWLLANKVVFIPKPFLPSKMVAKVEAVLASQT